MEFENEAKEEYENLKNNLNQKKEDKKENKKESISEDKNEEKQNDIDKANNDNDKNNCLDNRKEDIKEDIKEKEFKNEKDGKKDDKKDNKEDDKENDEKDVYIDPKDLTIIEDPSSWEPKKEHILAFAKQLEFDTENDFPELLEIAKQYLVKPLKDNFLRAYSKDYYQFIYIDNITKEIFFENEIEKEAKEEYKNLNKIMSEDNKDSININDNKENNIKESINGSENKDEDKDKNKDKEKDKEEDIKKENDDNNEDNKDKDDDNVEYINEGDLIIITDPSSWKPPPEYIISFAKKLKFDVENDPAFLLDIAEKYLLKILPEDYLRAFKKENYEVVYIDIMNYDILLTHPYEEEAKKEYEKMKKKFFEETGEIIIDRVVLLDNYKYNLNILKETIKKKYIKEKNVFI